MKGLPGKAWAIILVTVGLTLCAVGLWQLLSSPQFEAVARVKVEFDQRSVASNGPQTALDDFYADSANQSQVIQNHAVADISVPNMPSARHKRLEASTELRPQIHVRLLRGTSNVFEVYAVSQNPTKAAEAVNAVADEYVRFKQEMAMEFSEKLKASMLHRAETPTRPTRPNHYFGGASFACGAVLMVIGFGLVSRSRQVLL